jgi:hypothetical protein
MQGLRQDVDFNNVGLDPTCCIPGSFPVRHALPVMVLCVAHIPPSIEGHLSLSVKPGNHRHAVLRRKGSFCTSILSINEKRAPGL